jgi:hypothetical protein
VPALAATCNSSFVNLFDTAPTPASHFCPNG